MKCSIVKDLLPGYVDSITSKESNMEIEEHLKECADCNQIYRQMVSQIDHCQVSLNAEEIKPLKKLYKKLRCRIIISVVITAIICVLAVGGYNFLFGHGWQAKSEHVSINYSFSDNEILFHVSLIHDRRLDVRGNEIEHNGVERTLSEILYIPFAEHAPAREGRYSEKIVRVPYIDENGSQIEFSDASKAIFKCVDKEIIFSLKEVMDERGTMYTAD